VPSPVRKRQPPRLGYIVAMTVSAAGHAALFALVFLVMPAYLHSDQTPPPAYTVKIVDNLPAGDLGTHLPRLSGRVRPKPPPKQIAKAEEHFETHEPKIEPLKPPPEEEKNAISLKSLLTPTPTPTPPPVESLITPVPTAEPTAKPAPKRTAKKIARVRPTPAPVRRHREHPREKPPVMIAKAERTPGVEESLAKIRQHLLAEHLKHENAKAAESAEEDETRNAGKEVSGGGPVVASVATEGSGLGVGPGTGSAGIQQDLQFLLYYRTVQQKIKKAWSFPGGPSDLTATVSFAIGPDGSLTAVRVTKSSRDPAFDESVIRAIRRAAPFPPPPDKYRSEFAGGIEALFKLGELKS
jgi:colicin import membrane protein